MVEIENLKYHMDLCLQRSLDNVKKSVSKDDADAVFVVDGMEGSGKSVFSFQIAKYLDNNFSVDNIFFTAEAFKRGIENAKRNSCIIFDEAFLGLSNRATLSQVNRILVSKMMQMRQKNLYVIVNIPSFFLLDRYVSLFRSRCLFHIYKSKSRRYWIGFNQDKKKLLFLLGKKTMSYTKPRVYTFKGRFYGKYTIDEEKYRKKKMRALEETEFLEDDSKYKIQRDILIRFCVTGMNLTYKEASRRFQEAGLKENLNLSRSQVGNICKNIAKTH